MTVEQRLDRLEVAVAQLQELLREAGLGGVPTPVLEDFHAATVAKVKQAKERGGLRA
jgi:hypothetical protein